MQRAYLLEAQKRYSLALPGSPAEEHLVNRKLQGTIVDRFKLGYVADPVPGHDQYKGMLAVPYLRRSESNDALVVSIRFRCLEDHEHIGHGKYNTVAGDPARLYNTRAITESDEYIAITEGEFDAIAMTMAGMAAVGIPGVQTWKDHFDTIFRGYKTVYVFTDGDEAGRGFGRFVCERLKKNAKQIPCPPGEDVNSWLAGGGYDDIWKAME